MKATRIKRACATIWDRRREQCIDALTVVNGIKLAGEERGCGVVPTRARKMFLQYGPTWCWGWTRRGTPSRWLRRRAYEGARNFPSIRSHLVLGMDPQGYSPPGGCGVVPRRAREIFLQYGPTWCWGWTRRGTPLPVVAWVGTFPRSRSKFMSCLPCMFMRSREGEGV